MKNKIKILFITPTSSRGGSEKYIWNLFMNLGKTIFTGSLFSLEKGILFDDFKNLSNTYYSRYTKTKERLLFKGLIRRMTGIHLIEKEIIKAHNETKAELWYINTCTIPEVANLAFRKKIPYIVHFHEMISVYESVDKNQFYEMLLHAIAIIVCSEAVALPLRNAGFKNVIVEYESVDLSDILLKTNVLDTRKQLGISNDKFIWLMSGQRIYRKGLDFLPEIAKKVNKNIHIIWIGGSSHGTLSRFTSEIIKNSLLNNITMIEEIGEGYYDLLNVADAFLLTSREDPFPLVMTEAAYLGKPIVGFDSGGINEFVIDGQTGFVIEAFNIEKIASIINLISDGKIVFNKELIEQRSLEFSLEKRIKIWEQKIEKLIR